MRTTVDLDERVLVVARAIAKDEGVSLGIAISRLALKGLRTQGPVPEPLPDGPLSPAFPTFRAEPDAPPITLEVVNRHRDGD